MSNQLPFEDQYFTILQSIESAIHDVYVSNPALLDFNVDKSLNAMVRTLSNEKRGRDAPKLRLKGDEQVLYKKLQSVSDIFLGRIDEVPMNEALTVDEMIACFRRIQRSIKPMSDQGRQGYLNFIKQFFGD